mmetsp:Transcript_16748/g.48080  ORF Transcript_16748/g.48080 Transcript_16748/m.48080 type:complete len:120 (+) Transcript_16748:215-574(+)|eukprot:CAMPEP_0181034038 /NCGR_PEP_ID=MMETSP1070-20121207/7595_1 /TAXON_ID=265543 /ORGANISM="Minutocellus polymorphus, Strain NH13" /LENGTH=119 /DNA_ID=CAMNT_0023111541 /DNA_START=164 /DNA_END=523 /DNA_ORIENTATION=-
MLASTTSRHFVAAATHRAIIARGLASAPAEKLRCAFEEYRRENFQRETPSRFKKELLKSVLPTGESVIPIDGINKLLVNIGHKDDCLSRQEQDELLDEAVGHHDTRNIPIEKIMSALFR